MKIRYIVFALLGIILLLHIISCEKDPTSSKDKTLIDIDGNVYQIVKIGDQLWISENLKVTHYRNGEEIPQITDDTEWSSVTISAYCNYNNNEDNSDIYGILYNWYAVNDSRNIAPEGWHVPSDEEWRELEMYLGMSRSQADSTGWRGTDEAGKIKEVGTKYWRTPNTGATNISGFSVLSSGYRSGYGPFDGINICTFFWTSSEGSRDYSWGRMLCYNHSDIGRYHVKKQYGSSVRLVKD